MNTAGASTLGRGIAVTAAFSAMLTTASWAAVPSQLTIPGERVFPESITSSADGSVYVGSVGMQMIFRVAPGKDTGEAFVQPGTGGAQRIFGVLADDRSRTLWACSSGFGAPPGGPPPGPSALHAFDLGNGTGKGRYELPTAGGSCNDIAVGPDGTAYVTDTQNMQLLRLPRGGKALEVWVGDGAFGPAGSVLDGVAVVGNRVIVNALATGKLFAVPIGADGKPGRTVELKLSQPLERPDGMRSFGTGALLTTETGGGGKLSKVTIEGDTGKVQVLKSGFPDGPASVTVVGETAYVVEGQLGALMRPPGAPGPAPQVKPFRATAVPVGQP